MKMVHINTSDSGGAGNAALRLHQALMHQEEGVASSFLCLKETRKKVKNLASLGFKDPSLIQKVMNKAGLPITRYHKNLKKITKAGGQKGPFTFPITDFDISAHPLVKQADIIHLHWVGNFLDWPSFFQKVRKPIVWTLHDRGPFLGGFHLQLDKDKANAGLLALENEMMDIKLEAIKEIKDIHVVTPSIALGELSKRSKIFGHFPHYHITNSIDTSVYDLKAKSECRKVFDVSGTEKVFLYASLSTKAPHKGFDLLVGALKEIPKDKKITVLCVGENKDVSNDKRYKFIDRINKDDKMATLYNAVDALILPSREENLPNVMLEAMACGTPVISFPVGGMKEVIQPGFNGIFAEDISSIALKNAITHFIDNEYSFSNKSIRDFAVEKFALERQATDYLKLYNKILA